MLTFISKNSIPKFYISLFRINEKLTIKKIGDTYLKEIYKWREEKLDIINKKLEDLEWKMKEDNESLIKKIVDIGSYFLFTI